LEDALPDPLASPSEQAEATERAAEVRKAVHLLPEELRTPLILFEYESLSHAEIGSVLNCSAKAVESRLYRARAQLRKHLPRDVHLHYAVKANPMPAVVQHLSGLVDGLDVASAAEMRVANLRHACAFFEDIGPHWRLWR
jgi:hypothetical protein